ncbi:unnamed protein product [Bemisia tabaci]|uniref:Uncharacterized protein n=1 Tax=Bemisia tabaci TaxID=7038 RepID=A0A9P0AL29_BEMTA|nr:unnamed protein product [Bemisia tabaci]
MKSLSGLLPVLAIFLSFDSVRARPQANGQPISGVGIVEKVERVNLHEKVNSSGSNNRVYLDVSSVRGTTEESREALLETSPPQIVADLKISSALTTSAVNSTNDETSRTAVTKPTPIGESLKTVTKQLLHSPSATDMAVTDVRTPPKIKHQLLSHEMIALGKGEAVPVIMEDENHNYEKLSSPQSQTSQSHIGIGSYSKRPIEDSTSQSGLSTWILLNNDNVHGLHSSTQNTAVDEPNLKMTNKAEITKTSPATFPENKAPQKKKHKPASTTPNYSTTESLHANTKQKEDQTASPKKPEKKPMINPNVKTSSTTPYVELYTERLEEIVAEIDPATGEKKPLITLQDSKFKNKTPVIVGRIPQKDKIEASTMSAPTSRTPTRIVSSSEPVTKAVNDNITRFGTPVVTFPHVPPRVRPSAQVKEDEKTQQTKLQLQKQQQQKLQTQYQQKLQQQKIQQQLQEQNTKPISTTMPPLFSPTTAAVTTPKLDAASTPLATNVTETTQASNTTATPSQAPTITATKKTKRPSQKRKKNKTRRKRPTKTSTTKNDLESKVSEQDNSPAAKIPGVQNKPLSTRIYNYLAREVVPNVGVGIVGLMLTAGLAGLLLYPFGGGIAARRTEKFSGNAPDGHNYYYNEYSTTGDMDHGQAEEQVFGQVLAGMSHSDPYTNAYSRERPNTNSYYPNPNNKYKPARYETVDDYAQAGIAGFKEDMTQESKYSTLGDVNKDYNADVNPKYPSVSINNQGSEPYAITDPESDGSNVNKYVDPTSSSDVKDQKFTAVAGSPTDVKTNTKYSSTIDSTYDSYSGQVGHGTVYNDEVGYGGSSDMEHKNHRVDYQTHEENVSMEKIKPSDASDEIITAEDNKSVSLTQASSKEEQPTYSALEGIPKRINYNYGYEKHTPSDETYSESFVPMNVNEQDSFNHRYSLQVEHGPRNLKLENVQITEQEPKVRRNKRQVSRVRVGKSDKEIENEIDGVLPEEMSSSTKKTDATKAGPSSSTAQAESSSVSTPENAKDGLKSTTTSTTVDATDVSNEDEEQFEGDKVDTISSEKPSDPDLTKPTTPLSFVDILKKVVEFKINLAVNVISTTADTLSRYFGTIQSKMVTAMRHINELDKEFRKGVEKLGAHVKDSKNKPSKDGTSSQGDSDGKPQADSYNLNDDISHIDMGIESDFSTINSNFNENDKIITSQPNKKLTDDGGLNNASDCTSKDNCNSNKEHVEKKHEFHSIRRRDVSVKSATKKHLNVKKYRPLKKT